MSRLTYKWVQRAARGLPPRQSGSARGQAPRLAGARRGGAGNLWPVLAAGVRLDGRSLVPLRSSLVGCPAATRVPGTADKGPHVGSRGPDVACALPIGTGGTPVAPGVKPSPCSLQTGFHRDEPGWGVRRRDTPRGSRERGVVALATCGQCWPSGWGLDGRAPVRLRLFPCRWLRVGSPPVLTVHRGHGRTPRKPSHQTPWGNGACRVAFPGMRFAMPGFGI
jgi:hypothetical protein